MVERLAGPAAVEQGVQWSAPYGMKTAAAGSVPFAVMFPGPQAWCQKRLLLQKATPRETPAAAALQWLTAAVQHWGIPELQL